jgi:hypothetical protein
VQQRIQVDALLGDLTDRSVLQLGIRAVLVDDVEHRVAHDAFAAKKTKIGVPIVAVLAVIQRRRSTLRVEIAQYQQIAGHVRLRQRDLIL